MLCDIFSYIFICIFNFFIFFFFNDTATTEIYTLSLHDALPIHSIKWSAIFALHSMHPISAVRQPCAAHSSVSLVENSLCPSYTGQTSVFPGSLLLFLAGSVTITLVFARMSASLSLSVIAFP